MFDRTRPFVWIVTAVLVAIAVACVVVATEDSERVALSDDPSDMFRRTDGAIGRYRTEKAFPNLRFNRPLAIVAPPDGSNRLFVCEQDGRISAFANQRDTNDRKLVLDIAYKTRRRHNEEGLLGLAFHPQFADNGYIYIHYSTNSPRRGVVSRFTLPKGADGVRTKADPASETILLQQEQPWGNHNGGAVEFGPDGYLYLTFGDGGAANDPLDAGQDLSMWLGKMLRIDVNKSENGKPYGIPADNPFVNVPGARPEIWAWGLRNLWRVTWDATSGLCIGGDVGQNALEEIDIIEKGKNYGWRAWEGTRRNLGPARGKTHPDGPFEAPIHQYPRRDGVSITGGYVYRGTRLPGLHGAYIYADYGSGNVWALRYDGQTVTDNQLITRHRGIASFGVDPSHELYICSFDGYIHRFVASDSEPPAGRLPQLLSGTGLFKSLAPLTPANGMVAFDVAVPLWSAGASKQRWIRLPKGQKATVRDDGTFAFPAGTLFIKHFALEMKAGDPTSMRPVETRVTIVQPDDRDPLRGFTYVWNDDGTEAMLLTGNARKPLVLAAADGARIDRDWHFPSRSECITCHTDAGNHVLGFRPEQLGKEQLEALMKAGVFAADAATKFADVRRWPEWDVAEGSSDAAAIRAYLDSNCASCHQPDGPGNATIDLRASTPLDRTGMVNVRPGQGDMDLDNPRIIAPADPARSILLARMRSTGFGAMPNVGHTFADAAALERLEAWIAGMPPADDNEEDFR